MCVFRLKIRQVKYGYGFVQGAEYAAQELGMADGSIELMYNYTGGLDVYKRQA